MNWINSPGFAVMLGMLPTVGFFFWLFFWGGGLRRPKLPHGLLTLLTFLLAIPIVLCLLFLLMPVAPAVHAKPLRVEQPPPTSPPFPTVAPPLNLRK